MRIRNKKNRNDSVAVFLKVDLLKCHKSAILVFDGVCASGMTVVMNYFWVAGNARVRRSAAKQSYFRAGCCVVADYRVCLKMLLLNNRFHPAGKLCPGVSPYSTPV